MALESWLVYLLAATGLSLSPGPNTLLALAHGALYGRRRAMFTIIGGTSGFVIVIALSIFGIGALLQASTGALTALKWLGGAYLAWLGVQVWRAPPVGVDPAALALAPAAAPTAGSLFRQGALSALTNPKAILFFAAFLPQFIDPARSLALQFAVMASTFAVVEIVIEWVIASLAHRISPWLRSVGRSFNRACGGVFVVLGVALPLRG